MNASGIMTPIAALAPVEREDFDDVEDDEVVLLDVGVALDALLPVIEAPDIVVTPSKASISTSVFCHKTGIPSQTAEVSFGTVQVLSCRTSGRSSVMSGVG